MRRILLTTVFAITLSTSARALTLEIPVACTVGEDCFIQNYVDVDPGPGWKDFTCGPLSYDGHKGTDFRVPDRVAMRRGVKVLAAAAGTVRGVRDGMPDISIRDGGKDAVDGRECGNGLAVAHEDGFETQYCHLKNGTLTVKPGDTIRVGQVLGEIGLSGNTEFPHLHLAVRKDGAVIDPFLGTDASAGCAETRAPLWSADAQAVLEYRSSALLNAGFTDRVPDAEAVREGEHRYTRLRADAPAVVFWADVMGVRTGDTLRLSLRAPDGAVLAEKDVPFTKHKALWFQFIGKKRSDPRTAWPEGEYTAYVALLRDADTVWEATRRLTVP